jgi:hypothetical protein
VLQIDGSSASTQLVISDLLRPITKVTTSINLTKCNLAISNAGVCEYPGRSYNEEIGLALKSPTGTTVALLNVLTLGGQTPGGTVTWLFDDAASSAVRGDTLISGTFLPASSLGAFNGEVGNGIWELLYTDDAGGDPLSINSWSLSVSDTASTRLPILRDSGAAPAPGPLPILGASAALGWGRRLRKRINPSRHLQISQRNNAG